MLSRPLYWLAARWWLHSTGAVLISRLCSLPAHLKQASCSWVSRRLTPMMANVSVLTVTWAWTHHSTAHLVTSSYRCWLLNAHRNKQLSRTFKCVAGWAGTLVGLSVRATKLPSLTQCKCRCAAWSRVQRLFINLQSTFYCRAEQHWYADDGQCLSTHCGLSLKPLLPCCNIVCQRSLLNAHWKTATESRPLKCAVWRDVVNNNNNHFDQKAMAMWSLLVSALFLSHSMVLLLTGQCLSTHCYLSQSGAADGCICASSLTNSNTEHSRTPLEERKKNQ